MQACIKFTPIMREFNAWLGLLAPYIIFTFLLMHTADSQKHRSISMNKFGTLYWQIATYVTEEEKNKRRERTEMI